ncbi:hypothetical protein HDU86_005767 [Geranomyces michiganensis]|nr:hypothetical protein HDU86_005767 [Geranomyces michiganensis]
MPTSITLQLLSATTAKLAAAHRARQLSRESSRANNRSRCSSASSSSPPSSPPATPSSAQPPPTTSTAKPSASSSSSSPSSSPPPPPPAFPSQTITLSPLHHSLLLTRLVRALRKAWEAECIVAWSAGDSAVDLRWDDEQSGAEEDEDDGGDNDEDGDNGSLVTKSRASAVPNLMIGGNEEEEDEKMEVLRWIEDIARLAKEPSTVTTVSTLTNKEDGKHLAVEENNGEQQTSAPVSEPPANCSSMPHVQKTASPSVKSTPTTADALPITTISRDFVNSMFDDSLFDLSWEISL